MKKTTVFALLGLVLAIMSCIVAYTDQVLIVLISAPLAIIISLLTLFLGWKTKSTRLFAFISIALGLYAFLEFYKINATVEEDQIPQVEVEEGEAETDKVFEEQLNEEGFDLEDDEEPIE